MREGGGGGREVQPGGSLRLEERVGPGVAVDEETVLEAVDLRGGEREGVGGGRGGEADDRVLAERSLEATPLYQHPLWE